jgi:hypothetical protein
MLSTLSWAVALRAEAAQARAIRDWEIRRMMNGSQGQVDKENHVQGNWRSTQAPHSDNDFNTNENGYQ